MDHTEIGLLPIAAESPQVRTFPRDGEIHPGTCRGIMFEGDGGRIDRAAASGAPAGPLGLVLTGGGARAAYQVGVLASLARRYPELRIPVLTGISSGAINAAHLAASGGTFGEAVEELRALWSGLSPEQVFRVDAGSLLGNVARWGLRLVSGGSSAAPQVRGLVDTTPLREFLERALPSENGRIAGIDENIRRGALDAVGITTTCYGNGSSVVWIQGNARPWERPQRRSVPCRLGIDHIMASAALPLFFPAVRIGRDWYGDGGIRLAAPLSPALHLGARRLLAVSTRHDRIGPHPRRDSRGYPAPAQVAGVLMNSIFLDLIDQDVLRFERLNRLLERMPPEDRMGLDVVNLLVLRPSEDLGRLARHYEPRLPGAFRFLTRGLGTRQTRSPDMLSMLMFQGDYLTHLIRMGEADAEARADEIAAFIEPALAPLAAPREDLRTAAGG
jgi:NTE family protein